MSSYDYQIPNAQKPPSQMSISQNTEITIDQPKIVCICGSLTNKEAFGPIAYWLTQEGCTVLSIVNDPITIDEMFTSTLEQVKAHKVKLCDELIILNLNGYIDDASRAVISFAHRLAKPIRFLESPNWQPPERAVRHRPKANLPFSPSGFESVQVEEGAVLDISKPFWVNSGAVLLYGPDPTRPAFTLVADNVWPGVAWVPEVWYAEAASNTSIRAISGDEALFKPLGEVIRWAVATSGQIWERILWGLFIVGSVSTQDELSAIIGCRRESVTSAIRDLREQGLIEKVGGRIRLNEKGLVCASQLCSLERDSGNSSSEV